MTSIAKYIIRLFLILLPLLLICSIAYSQQNLIGAWEDKKFKGEFIHFKNDSTMIMKDSKGFSMQLNCTFNYETKPISFKIKYKDDINPWSNIVSPNGVTGKIEFITEDEIYLEIQLYDEQLFGENSKIKAHLIRSEKK